MSLAPPLPLSKAIKVGNKFVGSDHPCFIIAEIGNNHNGDFELAKKSVKAAAFAGADAVKFQKRFLNETFTKEMLASPQTSSRGRGLGSTYGEYRRKLELSEEDLCALKVLAHELGMVFFVTAFDLKGAELLSRVGMDCWKIASFDLTHTQLLEYVAQMGQPIFMSTGMSDLFEVDRAVDAVLKYNDRLIIKHCVSVYPTPDDDLNIGAIPLMIKRYTPLPIGYSGHEIGFVPTVVAVALGASSVERHFTLDKTLPGPDHATVSLDPIEFSEMTRQIRRIEKAVKDNEKYLHEKEVAHRNKHSKSIVARVNIPVGVVITAEMICFKSPGHGIKPYNINRVVGKTAKKDIPEDTIICEDDIKNTN